MKISKYTDEKLLVFKRMGTSALWASANIVRNHANPKQRHIYAVDVCCGDGEHSTMQLFDCLVEIEAKTGVTFSLYGVEKRGDAARHAQALYVQDDRVTILHGACETLVPEIARLIYEDSIDRGITPFGVAIYDSYDGANWQLWVDFSLLHRTIDLVLLHSAGWRRHPYRGKDWQDAQKLSINRPRVRKTYMLIGERWGKVDFTTLYFTNSGKLAAPRPGLGMESEGSARGKERVRHISTTKQEREEEDALTVA